MAGPIKICKQRLESETYWTPHKELGKPLIINVREARIDLIRKRRDDSDEDCKMLMETLPKLGFGEPCVMDKNCLNDRKKFFEELERIAQDDRMTKDADVFLCIIMAFGNSDYIYLTNEGRNTDPENSKVNITDIINIFKSNHCHRLVCKPKIFIVHTDDPSLRKYDASLFQDGSKDTVLKKVPVEADIIIYHSELSAEYTKKIAKEEPGDYAKLIEKGLVQGLRERNNLESGDNPTSTEERPGTHFIFTLCNAAKILMKEGKFDMLKWVFLTNKAIKEFLDTKLWLTWRQGKWSKEPRVPVCTLQSTKNIRFELTKSSDTDCN